MIRSTKYILFYLAGFLAVLHGVLPHVHSDQLHAEHSQHEDRSILDYVLDLIDEDLGEGHLEFFQASDLELNIQFNYVPGLPALYVIPTKAVTYSDYTPIFVYTGFGDIDGCLPTKPSRGPPQA